MKNKIIALFVLSFLFSFNTFAQETGEQRYGVIQNIAEDRKVERVGGVYSPEGIDKYMKRRFDAIESQISELSAQMVSLQKSMEGLREELKKQEDFMLVS